MLAQSRNDKHKSQHSYSQKNIMTPAAMRRDLSQDMRIEGEFDNGTHGL